MTAVNTAPVSFETLEDPAATAAAWERYIDRAPLADTSKATYAGEVRAFATWLAGQDRHRPLDVFTDPMARDYAVKDYRHHLLAEKKRAPKGVETALTSVANLFEWVGLGAPVVRRAKRDRARVPKAVPVDDVRHLLWAAQTRPTAVRDGALVSLAVFTGLRVSEMAALDTDDYSITDRKGRVIVRAGKGGDPREVDLNKQARQYLLAWERERRTWLGADTPALFLSRRGARLASRTIRYLMSEIGETAGVKVHPHALRHTFGSELARLGTPVTVIADLMGHRDINTTRQYLTPTAEDLAEAVESFAIDL